MFHETHFEVVWHDTTGYRLKVYKTLKGAIRRAIDVCYDAVDAEARIYVWPAGYTSSAELLGTVWLDSSLVECHFSGDPDAYDVFEEMI